jgi:hypothetical protein
MELILKLIKKPNYNEPRFEDQKLIKQKKNDSSKLMSAISQQHKLRNFFLNARRKVSR